MAEDRDRFFTVEEAASILKVTPRTIRAWLAQGKVQRAPLPGRTVRIPAGELDRLEGRNTEGDPKAAPDA